MKEGGGNHIILGVTGSIAAYKAADIVRELSREGFEVKVVTTSTALKFITPLTLEILSSNQVVTELFPENRAFDVRHISLAQWGDLLLVAPATANMIGKMASGIADDFLSTLALTFHDPVLLAPAMNTRLMTHPIVERNLNILRELGHVVIESGEGDLACGERGRGRLADIGVIVDAVKRRLGRPRNLLGKHVVVTAGATEEPLDPVRILTNRASGKMGVALALSAGRRGAKVTLVHGRITVPVPSGVSAVPVTTAKEMRDRVIGLAASADIVIKAAAVGDFCVKDPKPSKVKKTGREHSLVLSPTPDILKELGAKKRKGQILVGFALETENLLENALNKLKSKNLDLIVVNDALEEGSGFRSDTNRVLLLDRLGNQVPLPMMGKDLVAERILDHLRDYFQAETR